MRHVELVIFENNSVMHEKALSLPIGKVSFRQLGVILSGILAAMVSYFVTKDFVTPGVVLAIFLGLGLVNTKIMSPDQVIKANLIFLIRGTSLNRGKPENLKSKSNKNGDSKNYTNSVKRKPFSIMSQIILQLQSLLTRKQSKENTNPEKSRDKIKNYSIKVEVTKNNLLKITPKKNTNIKSLQDQITILLDKKETRTFTLTDKHLIIPLSKFLCYEISTVVDNKE